MKPKGGISRIYLWNRKLQIFAFASSAEKLVCRQKRRYKCFYEVSVRVLAKYCAQHQHPSVESKQKRRALSLFQNEPFDENFSTGAGSIMFMESIPYFTYFLNSPASGDATYGTEWIG